MAISWPLPFKGRGSSGAYEDNFVWSDRSVYVMDNHRAALWCWAQELDLTKPHALFHIDRHYDTLRSRLQEWHRNMPKPSEVTIREYLDCTYLAAEGSCKVFRWDNYLSLYFEEFGENVSPIYLATHREGDSPNCKDAIEAESWQLIESMTFWIQQNASTPWILNVDLDYFFCNSAKDESWKQMFSDEYIGALFGELASLVDQSIIKVVTICLTPDAYTAGWPATERLAEIVCDKLGRNFKLP